LVYISSFYHYNCARRVSNQQIFLANKSGTKMQKQKAKAASKPKSKTGTTKSAKAKSPTKRK
jgi:hypothetical protein